MSAGTFSGTYSVSYGYTTYGNLLSEVDYPAVAGLPAEDVSVGYNSANEPDGLESAQWDYVSGLTYTEPEPARGVHPRHHAPRPPGSSTPMTPLPGTSLRPAPRPAPAPPPSTPPPTPTTTTARSPPTPILQPTGPLRSSASATTTSAVLARPGPRAAPPAQAAPLRPPRPARPRRTGSSTPTTTRTTSLPRPRPRPAGTATTITRRLHRRPAPGHPAAGRHRQHHRHHRLQLRCRWQHPGHHLPRHQQQGDPELERRRPASLRRRSRQHHPDHLIRLRRGREPARADRSQRHSGRPMAPSTCQARK